MRRRRTRRLRIQRRKSGRDPLLPTSVATQLSSYKRWSLLRAQCCCFIAKRRVGESRFYLFLDDFHLIADVRRHDLIEVCAALCPLQSASRARIADRSRPFLLSQVRLDDEILEINATLLSFNLQENMHFLGEALISQLGQSGVEKTAFWPARDGPRPYSWRASHWSNRPMRRSI